MNIFALSKDPEQSARWMIDRHVIKMVLETAQVLSTVYQKIRGPNQFLYKPTHHNHPSTLWAGASYQNFKWLMKHFQALAREYTYRYGKRHLSFDKVYPHIKDLSKSDFPSVALTPVTPAMKPEYKVREADTWEDVQYLYRRYYCLSKQDFATWKHREPPAWYVRYYENRGYKLVKNLRDKANPYDFFYCMIPK